MAQTPQRWFLGLSNDIVRGEASKMRQDYFVAIILALAAIPAGTALMAAPEYLHLTGPYLALTFWGGVLLTLLLIFFAIAVALRGDAKSPAKGHRQRMVAIMGMAVFGLGFIACAVWFFAQRPEVTESVKTKSALEARGPTLEANTGGKIDATGAVIPGDLPFQFGKADTGGIIDIPGLVVTRQTDGSLLVEPGKQPVDRKFPAPTGKFSTLSATELTEKLRSAANELRVLDETHSKEFAALYEKYSPQTRPSEQLNAEWQKIAERHRPENERYAKLAQSLASESLARIGSIDTASMSAQARSGGIFAFHGKFAGPHPAIETAEFLEALSKKLTP